MAFTQGRVWTDEELSVLKDLVQTHTWKQIGEHFNCHPDAARLKAKTLGLRKKILVKAKTAEDNELFNYSEEHGIIAAAARYQVSKDQVKNARRRVQERRKEAHEQMDGEYFYKFRNICMKTARNKNFAHLAEDFADWAVLKVLEGRSTRNTEFLIADYIRGIFGKVGNTGNLERRAEHNAKGIVEDYDEDGLSITVAAPQNENKEGILFAILDELRQSGVERAVFLMFYRDGMSQEIIGKYFGFSHTRISQILRVVKDQIIACPVAKELLRD